ncbi:hypothetical protein ABT336_12775 [Micromonospora sp. NPDC000207]|uniref:hypothetical protein n=1 Tax=Micromonospora sp. NPDC000207 TaxID=3154246 RepID=UPI00332FAA07
MTDVDWGLDDLPVAGSVAHDGSLVLTPELMPGDDLASLVGSEPGSVDLADPLVVEPHLVDADLQELFPGLDQSGPTTPSKGVDGSTRRQGPTEPRDPDPDGVYRRAAAHASDGYDLLRRPTSRTEILPQEEWRELLAKYREHRGLAPAEHPLLRFDSLYVHLTEVRVGKIRLTPGDAAFFQKHPQWVDALLPPGSKNRTAYDGAANGSAPLPARTRDSLSGADQVTRYREAGLSDPRAKVPPEVRKRFYRLSTGQAKITPEEVAFFLTYPHRQADVVPRGSDASLPFEERMKTASAGRKGSAGKPARKPSATASTSSAAALVCPTPGRPVDTRSSPSLPSAPGQTSGVTARRTPRQGHRP